MSKKTMSEIDQMKLDMVTKLNIVGRKCIGNA